MEVRALFFGPPAQVVTFVFFFSNNRDIFEFFSECLSKAEPPFPRSGSALNDCKCQVLLEVWVSELNVARYVDSYLWWFHANATGTTKFSA